MEIITYTNYHLVKSEDLNHHGTLYAGRTAEWFVESGFIAAASATKPENIVCLKIHGMLFTRPVRRGDVVCFKSKIVHTGRTRLIAYIDVVVREETVVSGFITFIHVDADGQSLPHGVEVTPVTPEDIALAEQAKLLK
jgi:acyl-CoA hydrolase